MYITDEEAWKKSRAHLDDLIRNAPPDLFVNDDLAMHSKSVLDWGLIIKEDASPRLKIALYLHDMERADEGRVRQRDDEDYDEYKKRHQERSAYKLREFLTRIEACPRLIEDAYQMVLYHDVGDLKTDDIGLYKDYRILKDADSITFFETAFDEYIKKRGIEDTKDKLKRMYDKLTVKAKARPEVMELYENFRQKIIEKEKGLFS